MASSASALFPLMASKDQLQEGEEDQETPKWSSFTKEMAGAAKDEVEEMGWRTTRKQDQNDHRPASATIDFDSDFCTIKSNFLPSPALLQRRRQLTPECAASTATGRPCPSHPPPEFDPSSPNRPSPFFCFSGFFLLHLIYPRLCRRVLQLLRFYDKVMFLVADIEAGTLFSHLFRTCTRRSSS